MHNHGSGHGHEPRNKGRFQQRLGILRDSALHRQVKQHLDARRWCRRQWIHASLFACIGVMVATIVPGFSAATQPASPVTPLAKLPLALPELTAEQREGVAGDSWQLVRVKPGQTLSGLFAEYGIPAASLHALMQNKDAKAALTRLKPGSEIALDLPVEGNLRALRYERDLENRVELTLDGDTVTERVIPLETSTRTVVISGKVGRSLFHSARKLGLSAANINTLTDEIFKYDIDFNEDVAASDRFSVVVEQTWREGQLVKSGPVTAATFTTGGKLHSGFLFARDGKPEYFTGDGRPLKKSFIRMPIPYARLSSSFGARKHPILGKLRMHKGVDYAAGTGTPIMAAGDARVQFAGRQNGYGNVVILDHGRGYTTLYGHMSRFGKIRTGQRVAQGTVIGYVGSTGLATGPHLHYEFRVNGVHRNPLSVTMPPPEPLSGPQLAAFRSSTANALARIRTVENLIYADAEPAKRGTLAAAEAAGKGKKG
ncbi:MAG: peptidoglycan DD-metalloendopeptidase family protein [Pseudoxanthomonas sp.]